jgi:hypothetical protein
MEPGAAWVRLAVAPDRDTAWSATPDGLTSATGRTVRLLGSRGPGGARGRPGGDGTVQGRPHPCSRALGGPAA